MKRNYALDIMKAFAIYLVLMDHLISCADGIDNAFRAFIYSCHMPLFFFVSGVLAYKKLDKFKDIDAFFIKKCRLIIPVVVFGLGNVIILHQDIGEFLIWHKFGLWFLWTLFIFFSIYCVSQLALVRNKNKVIEVIGLLLPALICVYLRGYKDTAWGVINCMQLYNYVFFLAGVLVKRYDSKSYVQKNGVQFIILIVYIIGLASGKPYLNIPMKLCAVLFAYAVCLKLTTNWHTDIMKPWQVFLSKVGQSSLYIYILHYYFIGGIRHLPDAIHSMVFSSAFYYLLVYIVVSLFVICACMLIAEVLKTNKIIRILAFGIR